MNEFTRVEIKFFNGTVISGLTTKEHLNAYYYEDQDFIPVRHGSIGTVFHKDTIMQLKKL